jgi:hypothetical protein
MITRFVPRPTPDDLATGTQDAKWSVSDLVNRHRPPDLPCGNHNHNDQPEPRDHTNK